MLTILAGPAHAERITVFAASSLTNVLTEIGQGWAALGHPAPRFAFAGSSAVARQIEAGAPADVVVLADADWMAHLDAGGHLTGRVHSVATNALVLIAPAGAGAGAGADADGPDGLGALASLGAGPLAMANTEAVPAGRYGRAALEALGLWDGLADRVAQTDNVRAALLLVSRGEAPLGVVYATDARIDPGVRVVARFVPDLHPPILYPAAAVTEAGSAFVDYLTGPAAQAVFAEHGFGARP